MNSAMAKPVIGIIGGIGAGKSAVAAALGRRGGGIVDGDLAGHAALENPDIRDQIAKHWPAAMSDAGEVDRRKLGHVVFADPGQLRLLESIVSPWIKERLKFEIEAAKADLATRFV